MISQSKTLLSVQPPKNEAPPPVRKDNRHKVAPRTLNVPFFVGSVVLLGALAIGTYFLHSWQLNRTATVFLDRANHFEEKNQWLSAAEYINRYLQLAPEDHQERIRLARIYRKGAATFPQRQRAIELTFRAIGVGVEEEELSLRKEVGELLLANGRYVEAGAAADLVLAQQPKDRVALRLRGLSLYRQYESGALAREKTGEMHIIEALVTAFSANKDDIELATLLAGSYRDDELMQLEMPDIQSAERKRLADSVMDQLIWSRSEDPRAHLARYAYRQRWSLEGADKDLKKALEIAPDDVNVLLAVAQDARIEADRKKKSSAPAEEVNAALKRAEDVYRRILDSKLAPRDPLPQVALGEVVFAQGRKEEAVKVWEAGLAEFKTTPGPFYTHLADVWLEMDELTKAAAAIESIEREIAKLPKSTEKRARLSVQRDQEFRRGLWRFKRGEMRLAIPHFQQAIQRQDVIGGETDSSTRSWLLLGSAHAANAEWNESAKAFDRASAAQPRLAASRIAAATSWLSANRHDMAVERAEQAVRLESSCKAWFALAAATFQQQIMLAPQERVWDRFQRALEEATKLAQDNSLSEPWRVDLLMADFLLAKGGDSSAPDQGQTGALQVLRLAEAKYGKMKGFWQMLPLVYQRLGRPNDADRAYRHLAQLPGTSRESPLVHVRLLSLRGLHDEAQAAVAKSLEGDSVVDPIAARKELVNVLVAKRDLTAARTHLEQLVSQNAADLDSLRRLGEIDLENRKIADLPKWEAMMKACGGVGDTLALYFKVRRLVMQSTSAIDPILDEALGDQKKLENLRPTWAEAVALRGLLHQRRGRLELAVDAYEQAIQLGEQRLSIYEQLIGLLEQANRSTDAEKYLSRLKSHVPFSQDLTVFESTVEIRRNQPGQAIEVAQRGVEHRPKDASAHVWLGRVLLVNGRREEAELAFEKAIELDSTDVRSWNGLFSFCLRTGNKEKGRETLRRLAEKAKLTKAERSFVMAQGYELLGDTEVAAEEYRNAAQEAPENTAILLRMAGFYLRDNADEAQACLRKVLRIDPKSGIARRTLAAILASRGKEEDWQEVDRLLGNDGGVEPVSQDNRLRAVLLAQRGGEENFHRAVRILEEIVSNPENLVAADRLMLAQLYEKQGRIARDDVERDRALNRARDQFVTLCARSSPQPSHVVAFVEFLDRHQKKDESAQWRTKLGQALSDTAHPSAISMAEYVRLNLAHKDLENAERWLEKLEKAEPDTLATITLRARVMQLKGQGDEIEPFVETSAKRLAEKAVDNRQKAAIYQGIGNVYAAIDRLPKSEEWHRECYELVPAAFEPLANVLVKQGRVPEAIEICRKAAESTVSSRPAQVITGLLVHEQIKGDAAQSAEKLIEEAMAKYPQDLRLLFNVGTLRVIQGRTTDAAALFKRVVDLNPRNVLALNNLATLLSDDPGQRQEALKLIDQAIEISGSEAALFDTKGTILVLDGQSNEALEFLKAAVQGSETDPRYRFHLALAYRDLKEVEQARGELERALQQDLEKQILTPTEQKLLSELRSILTP